MTGGEPSGDAYEVKATVLVKAGDVVCKCARCNEDIIKPNDLTMGYGSIDLGDGPVKVCYKCCAEIDKQWMRDYNEITLYFDNSKHLTYEVINWPGSLRFNCFTWKHGNHNWHGVKRIDVWFTFEGYVWWGVHYGSSHNLVRCKKTKHRS